MRNVLFYLLFISLLVSGLNEGYSKNDKAKEDKKEDSKNPLNPGTFSGLKLRSIGPALASGRVVDLAVNPEDNSTIYAAVACGGVWKTTNYGIKWNPIFDSQASFSIGCITIDPNNPYVVWIGTGENNSQRSVSYGDGIYKSSDGGKTWKNKGLKKSEHIGKIIVDPKNSDIIYVAAQGPLWGPGGDRGLYKSTDGGETWEKSLYISDNTGVSDIAMDPRDNKVLYATSYQRRRHVWTLINGGPEGAIYKTTDAGKTWFKLENGIPGAPLGRIGIAVSPVNPDVIYALIEASEDRGGFFRSTDRGASWEKRGSYVAGSPQYYQELFCDPKDVDRVYSVDTYTQVTDDGGKTFRTLGLKERHVDDHALWIDPRNTGHLLIGGDGGIYESYDLGGTWRFFENLPVTQFYRIATDNALPFYNVYGGTQDNASIGGPSRTVNEGGIMNQDWIFTKEGDGFQSRVDPTNPDIVYSQAQYGSLVRFDKKSGERVDIQPQEEKGEELRWNWDSPLIISPHSPSRLYFAANKLFRSDDRGNTWRKISGDLSRQIDRNQLEVMGKIQDPEAIAKNASTSFYGNIVSLNESPLKENLLFVGTDDGLIQITEDAGNSWTKIEKIAGIPDRTYVSDILPSQFNENVVYATFDNHKMADFKPYVMGSSDKGKTWESISGNLPENGVVYTIVEDFVNSNLLFVGTEFGLFFTPDGGKKWVQLKGGLPTIAVRDIEIQKRESDLALATFGRGFYILDNYSPLRDITEQSLQNEATIFPIRDALMYIENVSVGRRNFGENFYRAENPPFGATITYYFKESIKTKKDLRKEKAKELQDKGQTPPYPTNDELRAEDLEEAPYLLFEISDEAGNVVRKLKTGASAGINRITWDLRFPDTSPLGDKSDINKHSGMPVLPGKYQVSMFKVVDGKFTKLAGPIMFNTKSLKNTSFPPKDPRSLDKFYKDLQELQRIALGADKYFQELKGRIAIIRTTLNATTEATADMKDNAKAINDRLTELEKIMYGDNSLSKRNENQTPSLMDRMGRMFYYTWLNTSEPTKSYTDNLQLSSELLYDVLAKLKDIDTKDMKALNDKLDSISAPWTPGRFPSIKK